MARLKERARIKVRQASPADVELLRRWRNEARKEHDHDLKESEHVDTKRHYIAMEGGAPVGMINLRSNVKVGLEGGKGGMSGHWIDLGYVPPKHRRRGIGEALLKHIDRIAADDPYIYTIMSLSVGGKTASQLERNGYEKRGIVRGFYRSPGRFSLLPKEEREALYVKTFPRKEE